MPATSVSTRKRQKISQEIRDRIVLEHLPLVKAIAIRVHENLPVHVDLDDLIHAGVLGLFDSVTKYDPTKNVAFHAMPNTASKARSSTACGRWTGRRATCANGRSRWTRLTQDLSSKLGRTPNENEMAEQMGVSVDAVAADGDGAAHGGLASPPTRRRPERDLDRRSFRRRRNSSPTVCASSANCRAPSRAR